MIRYLLIQFKVFKRFRFPDDMCIIFVINQNNIWSQCNKLHPLGHIVCAHFMNHQVVSFFEQWHSYALAYDVDIHAKRTVQHHFFCLLPKCFNRAYLVIIPK